MSPLIEVIVILPSYSPSGDTVIGKSNLFELVWVVVGESGGGGGESV